MKIAEIGIMALGLLAIDSGSLALLMTVLFAMGVHSTVFGPVKYSMLPQHLSEQELMGGTGLVEAGTFLAILAGQLAGGLLTTADATHAMLGVAALGLVASLFIPPAPAAADRPAVELNLIASTARIVAHSKRNRNLFLSILGITWFFSLGAVLTQQFVPLVGHLNATQAVGALFLGLFSVGVAIGAMVVSKLLGGEISARYAPASALVLALAVIDLGITVHGLVPSASTVDIGGFLRTAGSWHLVVDLLAIAIAGGVFIVPLYALLQTLGDPASRSRDVAANNIVNAAGMVLVSAVVAFILWSGAGSATLFVVLGLFGLVVALVACALLPETALKSTVRTALRRVCRVDLIGGENMPLPGARAVTVKIGGVPISLPAVEGYAAALWPGFDHAVVTRPDPRKGEQLVLFTTKPGRHRKRVAGLGEGQRHCGNLGAQGCSRGGGAARAPAPGSSIIRRFGRWRRIDRELHERAAMLVQMQYRSPITWWIPPSI